MQSARLSRSRWRVLILVSRSARQHSEIRAQSSSVGVRSSGSSASTSQEGGGLSAGEKQLLAIARAFLVEPAILVLDEATSSVDTRTDIQRAMSSLREGRTSFVIARRLSTIRDAEVILVMEAGHIVEQAPTTNCWRPGGAYARLYASQFAAAA